MRRAQPARPGRYPSTREFQSSPDACAGRNLHAVERRADAAQFQSSPDACAGRNLSRTDSGLTGRSFQSSPDACAGRNPLIAEVRAETEPFQSSPDACAGRNPIVGTAERHALGVSILARRMRRAQPWRDASECRGRSGFNPRPTHAPGATVSGCAGRRRFCVSILARRMRRAQQVDNVETMFSVTFQSSPDACAGRNKTTTREPCRYSMFQSSPDACAGRNQSSIVLDDVITVSILARRMRRAQRC